MGKSIQEINKLLSQDDLDPQLKAVLLKKKDDLIKNKLVKK